MKFLRRIKISKPQFTVISEIARDMAQILFASTVVSPVLLGFDKINIYVLITGAFVSILLWTVSVIIIKK